jgi:hypothetical protein
MYTGGPGHAHQRSQASLLPTTTYDTTPANDYTYQGDRDEDILVHFTGHQDGAYVEPSTQPEGYKTWDTVRRNTTKRRSRFYSARMSHEKTRKRDFISPGITVVTSFPKDKGSAPHQVFPQDDSRNSGHTKKPSWFGTRKPSTKNKGLGITKETSQPEITHRAKPSIDQSELQTAISLRPGSRAWQELSPWDQRIPIGISVPTDSVSEFSSYQRARLRSASEATLVTPNIVVTPAEAMKSVWSPDTAFTESDYTPSVYSHHPYSTYNNHTAPPVPALPAGLADSSGIHAYNQATGGPRHNRNDTLDSNDTAFEEDDDPKRSHRIMSTGTVFEEDDTPLRERVIEAPITIDTSLIPTPRRSQGWWDEITTPFVMTPNTAVFPHNVHQGEKPPAVPILPASRNTNKDAPSTLSNVHFAASDSFAMAHSKVQQASSTQPSVHSAIVNTTVVSQPIQQQMAPPLNRGVTSTSSVLSASPVVGTATLGTVLMPRQVEEQPRTININIELQDRRPNTDVQTTTANVPLSAQRNYASSSANQMNGTTSVANNHTQNLPVFAPPPLHATKNSHFSYDHGSRSSSPASTPDLKVRKEKKHRKVCDVMKFTFSSKQRRQDAQEKGKTKKKRGICFWGCCCCIILLVLLAILIPVVVVLTRRGDNKKPTSTQPDQGTTTGWLNMPNYPPMPTGILTVAQPEAVEEESGCVAPTTLWSCALPKELQDSIKPNKPDQPNFRIEVTFANGSAAALPVKRAANPASARAFIRSQMLKLRALPSPSPAPPNDADMNLLGKTTDGNTAPFDGEDTPLFITFQDPNKSASRLRKRNDPNDPTNITAVIPRPMLDSDGTAAAANLLPSPSAQPLRLFNRGKDNEYYGFYTYFDRSIFLKQINGTNRGGNPADVNGGSPKTAANLRCTFSETRFLVQIWTRSKTSKPLLQSSTQSGSSTFKRPGTFPYPVTITLDRHGGNAAKKNLYCYKLESDGTIQDVDSSKSFQFEDRGFGGNLVNGTQGRPTVTGPIDGGTGGCRCQWQNWLN